MIATFADDLETALAFEAAYRLGDVVPNVVPLQGFEVTASSGRPGVFHLELVAADEVVSAPLPSGPTLFEGVVYLAARGFPDDPDLPDVRRVFRSLGVVSVASGAQVRRVEPSWRDDRVRFEPTRKLRTFFLEVVEEELQR